MAALTWPIDVAQELKELEDEPNVVTDYASLIRAHVEYKAMLLREPACLRCFMLLVLPSVAKTGRYVQISITTDSVQGSHGKGRTHHFIGSTHHPEPGLHQGCCCIS